MESLKEAQSGVDEFERQGSEMLSWNRSDAASNLDRLSPPQRRRLYLSLGVSVVVDEKGEIDVRWPLGSIPPWRKDKTRMDILVLHVLRPQRG